MRQSGEKYNIYIIEQKFDLLLNTAALENYKNQLVLYVVLLTSQYKGVDVLLYCNISVELLKQEIIFCDNLSVLCSHKWFL